MASEQENGKDGNELARQSSVDSTFRIFALPAFVIYSVVLIAYLQRAMSSTHVTW